MYADDEFDEENAFPLPIALVYLNKYYVDMYE
jgi:hypothetical protein